MGMRSVRVLRRIAPWAIFVFAAAVATATFTLFPPVATQSSDLPAFLAYGLGLMLSPAVAFVGALITSNRPENRIGWMLVGLGLLVSLVFFASGYAQTGLPAADMLNVLSDAGYVAWVSLFGVLVFLFPDGRPLSPRWRPVVWLAVLWPPLLLLVALVVAPESLLAEEGSAPGQGALMAMMIATFIAAVSSALLRFARSHGVERQQLKWFAYATLIGLTVAFIGSALGSWGAVLTSLGLAGPIVGIAVALLRHNLYDIDLIVRRTLVYGTLTVLLGVAYLASVILLTQMLTPFTSGNALAVAASTLGVAALFRPLRSKVQSTVDRRFFRSRFHAGRIVEAFGAQLRHEVDVDSLIADLRAAVEETMRPASISVWLRARGR